MRNYILNSLKDCETAIGQLKAEEALSFMESTAVLLSDCFQKGSKVLVAGNGGSLCDAAHFAEELTGCFRKPRLPLPAIVLNEPSHITCTANDFGFEHIFSRGVEAFGQPGDVFIGLSTSGNSPNIVKAFETALQKKMFTIAFLGKSGGKLKGFADLELLITGFEFSDRVQEAHMAAMHIIIEMIEYRLFSIHPSSLEYSETPLR